MKRRDFFGQVGVCTLLPSLTLQGKANEEPAQKPFTWEPYTIWNGNDNRFLHRSGGRIHQGSFWLDDFSADHIEGAVCETGDKLKLEKGNYRVTWTAELMFSEPVCRNPSERYPSLLSRVVGNQVRGTIRQNWVSQVYVCANRTDLTYTAKLLTDFAVTQQGVVNISFHAYGDRTSEPTSTGAKEVIVKMMQVDRRAQSREHADGNMVMPISLGKG